MSILDAWLGKITTQIITDSNELVTIDWHDRSCVSLEGVHGRECGACPGVCARWVVPEGKLTMAANCFLFAHFSPTYTRVLTSSLTHLSHHTLTHSPLFSHPHRNGRIVTMMTSLSLNVSYCFSEMSSTSRQTHRRRRWLHVTYHVTCHVTLEIYSRI